MKNKIETNNNFVELITNNNFFVDRTLFIKDFMNFTNLHNYIIRPKGFGKSTILGMLYSFFDIRRNSTSLFQNSLIYQDKEFILNHMNKYEGLYIDFERMNYVNTYNDYLKTLFDCLETTFKQLNEISLFDTMTNNNTIEFENLLFKLIDKLSLNDSKVIVFIDNFDFLFISAIRNHFFIDVKDSLFNFFDYITSSNKVFKSILIGTSDVFNNKNYHFLKYDFEQTNENYFGFTTYDVLQLYKLYNPEERFEKILSWYCMRVDNNYLFNQTNVLLFFKNKILQSYTYDTVLLDIITNLLITIDFKDFLLSLLKNTYSYSNEYSKVVYDENTIINENFIVNYLIDLGLVSIKKNISINTYTINLGNDEAYDIISLIFFQMFIDENKDVEK